MTPYEEVMLASQECSDGETRHMLCPWCRGGRTQEQSMFVTKRGTTILYHCFRASCTGKSSGAIGRPARGLSIKKKVTPVREFTWETYPLSDGTREWLWDNYCIEEDTAKEYGLLQSAGGDVVVPMWSRSGSRSGNVVKLRKPSGRAKSMTYPGRGYSGLSWFISPDLPERCSSVVIVEDVFSAIRASQYMHAVSLNGTNMNPVQAQEIAAEGYQQILLCLDEDATAVAVRHVRKYRAILPNMRVKRLGGADFKNRTIKELDEFFKKELEHE